MKKINNLFKLLAFVICLILGCISCNSKSEQDKIKEKKFYSKHNQFLANNALRAKTILAEDFKFDGIEFLYVDLGPIYYSWWGHTVIRFVNSGLTPEEDLTVDFIADFNDYNLDNIKAYFGGYEVLPQVRQLKDLVQDYVVDEKRYLARYILPTNEKIKAELLRILRDWIQNPKNAGDYTFRKNNCSGILLKWLHQSGFELSDDYTYFPFDVPNELLIKKIARTPPVYVYKKEDSLKAIDKRFYERCRDLECSKEKMSIAFNLWGKKNVDAAKAVSHDMFFTRLFRWLGDLKDMFNKEEVSKK